MTIYVESSAAAKLLVAETETAALKEYLNAAHAASDALVSSVLLETEVRRVAVRLVLNQSEATRALQRFSLIDFDRAMFTSAGVLPGAHLRSLDALHVTVAVRASADAFVTYDDRQRDAAEAVGLQVVAPA